VVLPIVAALPVKIFDSPGVSGNLIPAGRQIGGLEGLFLGKSRLSLANAAWNENDNLCIQPKNYQKPLLPMSKGRSLA
jgi:hypothetical protein